MAKIIRPTYPVEFSIGLLILIFVLSFFLSSQIFDVRWHELMEGTNVYFGMFLVSSAVIIMVLILWEEFLFPIRIKPGEDGVVVFHNHRTKLKTQLLIYFIIPAIFVFIYIYFQEKINTVRFIVWAAICTIMPVAIKLFSGLNNYNDFLKLTNDLIEYKNNKESGIFYVRDIQRITPIRDERKLLHKVEVSTSQHGQVMIDLDEMELEAFLDSIDQFIVAHYPGLVKEKTA
jgi:hypothetical protein